VYLQKECIKDKLHIFIAEEEVQYTLTINAEKTNKKILGLKITLGEIVAHGQSPGDYFKAWCKIYNFQTIQSESEYSSVDIVLINILIDLVNANIVLIEKEHAATSSVEHFPLAI